jgi:hypothetical protein
MDSIFCPLSWLAGGLTRTVDRQAVTNYLRLLLKVERSVTNPGRTIQTVSNGEEHRGTCNS